MCTSRYNSRNLYKNCSSLRNLNLNLTFGTFLGASMDIGVGERKDLRSDGLPETHTRSVHTRGTERASSTTSSSASTVLRAAAAPPRYRWDSTRRRNGAARVRQAVGTVAAARRAGGDGSGGGKRGEQRGGFGGGGVSYDPRACGGGGEQHVEECGEGESGAASRHG